MEWYYWLIIFIAFPFCSYVFGFLLTKGGWDAINGELLKQYKNPKNKENDEKENT